MCLGLSTHSSHLPHCCPFPFVYCISPPCLSGFFFFFIFFFLSSWFILFLLSTLDVGNLGYSTSECFLTFECWSCKQLGWQLSCLSLVHMEMPTFASKSGVTMRQSYAVVSTYIAPFYVPASLLHSWVFIHFSSSGRLVVVFYPVDVGREVKFLDQKAAMWMILVVFSVVHIENHIC